MALASGTRIADRFEIIGPLGAGSMGEVYQAARSEAAPRRRAEAAVAGAGGVGRTPAPLRARGARRVVAEPSAHLHDLRRRPGAGGRRPAVSGDGTAEAGRRCSKCSASARCRSPPSSASACRSPTRSTRRTPPASSIATQAGQHLRHHARRRQAARLRTGRDHRSVRSASDARRRRPKPRPLTNPGTAVGTVALHVARAGARRSARSRAPIIFSFGLVLYEMLTGRRAFEGRSTTAIVDAILHAAPVGLGPHDTSSIPRDCGGCSARMLEQRPRAAAGERRGGRGAPPRGQERIDRRPGVRRGVDRKLDRLARRCRSARTSSGKRRLHAGAAGFVRPGARVRGARLPRRQHHRDGAAAASSPRSYWTA